MNISPRLAIWWSTSFTALAILLIVGSVWGDPQPPVYKSPPTVKPRDSGQESEPSVPPDFDAKKLPQSEAGQSARKQAAPTPETNNKPFLVDTNSKTVPVPGLKDCAAVAADSENFLVVWSRGWGARGPSVAVRVTTLGEVLDPRGIALPLGPAYAVTFDGSDFLIVDTGLRAARVSSAGEVLDSEGIRVARCSSPHGRPVLASGRGVSLVVWAAQGSAGWDVYAARLTSEGDAPDTAGLVVSSGSGASGYPGPVVEFAGPDFRVTWTDESDPRHPLLHTASLSPEGVVQRPTSSEGKPPPQPDLDSATIGGYMLSFRAQEPELGSQDIRGTLVCSRGTVSDSTQVLVSQAADYQRSPVLVSDGDSFLVIWEDWRKDSSRCDILGTLVSPTGRMPGTAELHLTKAPGWHTAPAVACDGEDVIAVWADWHSSPFSDDVEPAADGISGTRLTRSGVVLDSDAIRIAPREGRCGCPALATGAAGCLVVWSRYSESDGNRIRGVRLTHDGVLLDSEGIDIARAAYDPAVASDDDVFLVVWQGHREDAGTDILGVRINSQGVVLDTDPIAISANAHAQRNPAVASDGKQFWVVWEDERQGSGIYGARVTQEGILLDSAGLAISHGTGVMEHPRLLPDGQGVIVTWTASDTDFSYTDICCTRVSRDGIESDEGPVFRQAGRGSFWSFASDRAGRTLVVSSDWTGTVNGKKYNADRIWGRFLPNR